MRCLVIGENPGAPSSPYFYDPIAPDGDPVGVRRLLLPALVARKLITKPTLCAFKDDGFLFDHGIRCQLPKKVMDLERARAGRMRPSLADNATHLGEALLLAPKVWVMGGVARAAIASQVKELRVTAKSLKDPYVLNEKFFVSHYLRPRFDKPEDIRAIVDHMAQFLI
jgi:hypothetical protein